jgi:hypothetical protein
MIDDGLAAGGIGPEQFRDIWSHTVERTGEQMLVLAMLEQAVEDLGHYRRARHPAHRRIFDQTRRWIASNDRTWPYSFARICEMLDLPRVAIRARLLTDGGRAERWAGHVGSLVA